MPVDYKKYPPNWKSEIVPAVLARAKNCCENCELENKQIVWAVKFWIKEGCRYKLRSVWFRDKRDAIREAGEGNEMLVDRKKVVLTVSHTDHDEENHNVQIERLRALCQLCHLRYDAKEKYARQIKKWEKPGAIAQSRSLPK